MNWLWTLLAAILKAIGDFFRGTASDRAADEAQREAGRRDVETAELRDALEAVRTRERIDDEVARLADEDLRARLRGEK